MSSKISKKNKAKYSCAGSRKSDKPCLGYRYRAYPTDEQVLYFANVFGCCRFLWNRYVDDESYFYKVMGASLGSTPADYKEDYPFLAEVDSYALCNVQLHFQKAMKAFFAGNAEYPKFKKKYKCRNSYTTNYCKGNIVLCGDGIRLPKLPGGTLKLALHRRPPENAKLKSVTVMRGPDGAYYVSVLYEVEATATPKLLDPENVRAIGLDMSLPDFYVASDGSTAPCMKYFRESEEKLAWEQHKLSRMVKGSKNYERQKQRAAKVYAKVKHQRRDMLQKLSTWLVRNYDVICIEDLNMHAMAQMMNWGKTVNDNGWGMFVELLEQKCARAGKYLVRVDRWFPSSQTCSCCGIRTRR